MISAEVPVMLSKALELFITELSLRAWLQTEESKRRTVQVSSLLFLQHSQFNTPTYFRMHVCTIAVYDGFWSVALVLHTIVQSVAGPT